MLVVSVTAHDVGLAAHSSHVAVAGCVYAGDCECLVSECRRLAVASKGADADWGSLESILWSEEEKKRTSFAHKIR